MSKDHHGRDRASQHYVYPLNDAVVECQAHNRGVVGSIPDGARLGYCSSQLWGLLRRLSSEVCSVRHFVMVSPWHSVTLSRGTLKDILRWKRLRLENRPVHEGGVLLLDPPVEVPVGGEVVAQGRHLALQLQHLVAQVVHALLALAQRLEILRLEAARAAAAHHQRGVTAQALEGLPARRAFDGWRTTGCCSPPLASVGN